MLCELLQGDVLRDVPLRIVRITAAVLAEPYLEDAVSHLLHFPGTFDEVGLLGEIVFTGDMCGTEPLFDILRDGCTPQWLVRLDSGTYVGIGGRLSNDSVGDQCAQGEGQEYFHIYCFGAK